MGTGITTLLRNKGFTFDNARESLRVDVTKRACRMGLRNAMGDCPLFLAVDSLNETVRGFVQKEVTFIIFRDRPTVVVKYVHDTETSEKVGQWDRGDPFPPGPVTLHPPGPSESVASDGIMQRQRRTLKEVAAATKKRQKRNRIVGAENLSSGTRKPRRRLYGPRRIARYA